MERHFVYSFQIKILTCWFLWREENWRTQRKNVRARQEPTTNSTHLWHQVQDSNPGHISWGNLSHHCAHTAPYNMWQVNFLHCTTVYIKFITYLYLFLISNVALRLTSVPSFAWMSWWVCSKRQSTKTDYKVKSQRKTFYCWNFYSWNIKWKYVN